MAVIEQDRSVDVSFISLQSRRLLITSESTVDDMAVLIGLILAERVSSDSIEPFLAKVDDGKLRSVDLTVAISAILQSGQVPAAAWDELHQLWYRWKVPFGTASLHWWYLFCTALGRTGNGPGACDLWARWRDATSDEDVLRRLERHCVALGQDARNGIVAMHDDLSGLACLLVAAIRHLPLIPLVDGAELGALAAAGVDVVYSDVRPADYPGDRSILPSSLATAVPLPGKRAATLRELCLGRALPFGSLRDEALAAWQSVTDDERTYLLVHLEQRLASLEIVRLSYGNEVYDNGGIARVLDLCRSKNPADWSMLELTMATIAWFWQDTGFVIQELNQSEISLAALRVFLERRIGDYSRLVGEEVAPGLPLPALVERFAKIRRKVEGHYQRCLYFDGGNWERREFQVPRAEFVRSQQAPLPESLRAHLEQRFGMAVADGAAPEALKLYLRALLGQHRTPSELLIAVADWAANATDMPTDYAIFTVPYGVKLDRPWDIGIDEIFCYTAFRNGFQPKQAGVPLKPVGICNAIGQRMRYNAVKKAQNYALVKHMTPQSFLMPDISVAEDAHQGGHVAAGVRHTCRIPMAITYHGSVWKGIADVRLSRADYEETARFREDELVIAARYGSWAKAIADEAFAHDGLFDPLYCVNLDDGRDVAARLGRAS